MNYQHILKSFAAAIVLLAGFSAYASNASADQGKPAENYSLFSANKTSYSIFVSTEAAPSEIWAANELQHWLMKISGAYFSVGQYLPGDSLPQNQHRIYVGFSKALESKTGKKAPGEKDESFWYGSNGPEIYIYGGKQRGTMYGVFSFLENELGCRWYTPMASHIPALQQYEFTRLNHSESPGVQVRNDFFYLAFDPVWAARNKMNGRIFSNPVSQPGGTESYWGVHTFYYFVPPKEFFKSHPEYFSLIKGVRTANDEEPDWGKRGQLCLSNAQVLKIVTQRLKKLMQQQPEHMIYDVSQNDWRNPCQCNNCQAIVKKYGGQESGIIIWFVNQVAAALEKDFPGKYIGTLAYQYSRGAPSNIKPRKNVVVRLCPIEACVAHPLETCPKNESFMKDLKAWSAMAPHLYIWDYVVNFARYIMPYPNFSVLQPNIQTFAKNNAIGIMEQGSYQDRGGEFQELKIYLLSKLLWNPQCNVNEVIDDFMTGFYGKSGPYVRQYFNLLQSRVTPETHMFIGLKADNPIFSDELVKQSSEIMATALKVAENEEMARRVELATMPLLFLKTKRAPVASREDGTFERLLKILDREGINIISEYGESKDVLKQFVMNAK